MSRIGHIDIDVTFGDDVTGPKAFKRQLKVFGRSLGLKTRILELEGPSGWPFVRFTGTTEQLNKLLDRFEVDNDATA